MTTPLTPSEIAHLEGCLPTAITPSMLDGYLAASASGPNFVMPDQVLHWVRAGGLPDDKAVANLIVRHYQAVNDALNDQAYIPNLTDPQAWCKGYLASVAADMMAWAPLMAAQPELLKVIMSGAGHADLADLPCAERGFVMKLKCMSEFAHVDPWCWHRRLRLKKPGSVCLLRSPEPPSGVSAFSLKCCPPSP
jgi:hypothetical protein